MNKLIPSEVSIGDVMRLSLPLRSTVEGGDQPARTIVRWVVLLTSTKHVKEQVNKGDLIILPTDLQEQLKPSDYDRLFSKANTIKAAGFLMHHNAAGAAKQASIKFRLPLILVPVEESTRDIHKSIASLLVDRDTVVNERAIQLYRKLSEMSREDKGLNAMTEVMSKLTGKIVVIQDKRFDIVAISKPMGDEIDVAKLSQALRQREKLPPILQNRKAAAKARQSYWQQLLPIEDYGRLVSPIVSGNRARGYLSVVGRADELDLLDSLTVENGSAACAMEMAKVKAVSEARKELRGNFLEGILSGTLPERESERLATRLDHDTRPPHAVLSFDWCDEESPSLRRLETTVNWILSSHNRDALATIYGEQHVLVFQALRHVEDMDSAQGLANQVFSQIAAEFPDDQLVGGISGPAVVLEDWPGTYNEALQAMQLGRRLGLTNQLLEYSSLGINNLLCEIETLPVIQEFTEDTIGPLIKYDDRHRGSLLQTLEAYYKHHGNISQTAESLFVHRNTLLYRMERIQELTGQDLNQADTRLAMHLALKFWQLR